jgi:hypothetical protein
MCHTRARLSRKDWPTCHARLEILGRGSRGRNKRERIALVLCGVTNGMVAGTSVRNAFRGTIYANRSCEMKKHLCLVCGALAGITILHFTAFAETAKPNATAAPPAAVSAPLKTNGQSSKKAAKDCDDEWRADRETMMRRGMTEESYVEQCSVEDDVPATPSETKTNAAPSAAPK